MSTDAPNSSGGRSPPPAQESTGTRSLFALFAWGLFAYGLLVISWGYFLRISESGDGCGTDWPLCHGAILPSAAPFPTWVEFVHRASSGLVLIWVVAMVFWAFRRFERGHAVRWAAGATLLFTIGESAVGAVLVIFGWVALDISTARILIRPFHVTNTFFLIASLALTAWWASRGVARLPSLQDPRARPLLLSGIGILALAWTGSWTGLAGTAFPAESMVEGLGQYLDPEHLLVYLRVTHPAVAVVVVAILLRTAFTVGRADPAPVVRRLAIGVGALAGAQIVIGPATIALLHPTGLRLFHLFTADLLWVGVLLLGSAVLERPQAKRAAGRAAPHRARASVP